ncbi:MAG TPA: response regulator, partial [Thiobacillaceae bacterium]
MTPHPQTVYVIDDDDAVREALGALLESVSLRHQGFDSAEAFLAVADPCMRGCLLLDVRMPGMSGLELQRSLQDQGVVLQVIIITGHGDVPMAVRAL